MVLTMYFSEKDKTGKEKMLSPMAVACYVIVFLSAIGSVMGIISSEIMVYILVLSAIVIAIWFFATK
ncbi:unnamed protein product [marine sediment metagenome]|uniref:Uncharacterized protein n=1 Tax=marine sediment metagenome TaxID=412755 RepID=X1D341_9ZZZZ